MSRVTPDNNITRLTNRLVDRFIALVRNVRSFAKVKMDTLRYIHNIIYIYILYMVVSNRNSIARPPVTARAIRKECSCDKRRDWSSYPWPGACQHPVALCIWIRSLRHICPLSRNVADDFIEDAWETELPARLCVLSASMKWAVLSVALTRLSRRLDLDFTHKLMSTCIAVHFDSFFFFCTQWSVDGSTPRYWRGEESPEHGRISCRAYFGMARIKCMQGWWM